MQTTFVRRTAIKAWPRLVPNVLACGMNRLAINKDENFKEDLNQAICFNQCLLRQAWTLHRNPCRNFINRLFQLRCIFRNSYFDMTKVGAAWLRVCNVWCYLKSSKCNNFRFALRFSAAQLQSRLFSEKIQVGRAFREGQKQQKLKSAKSLYFKSFAIKTPSNYEQLRVNSGSNFEHKHFCSLLQE